MNSQQQSGIQITLRSLREAGFCQIEKDSFTNGIFDLILSDTGTAMMFVRGNTKIVNCITDMQILKTFINYHIITSLGICRQ